MNLKKTKEVEKLQFVERMRYKKHIRIAKTGYAQIWLRLLKTSSQPLYAFPEVALLMAMVSTTSTVGNTP